MGKRDNVIAIRSSLHPFDPRAWERMARDDPAWAARQISGLLDRALRAERIAEHLCDAAEGGAVLPPDFLAEARRKIRGHEGEG